MHSPVLFSRSPRARPNLPSEFRNPNLDHRQLQIQRLYTLDTCWNRKHNLNTAEFSIIKVGMTSIIAAVFKATIGLLVNKGRDKAAAKLKEGDVTDHKFRSLIVREIDDIKSKLDGLARKDLLASISFFKEGIVILCEVFEKANRDEGRSVAEQAASVKEDKRPSFIDVSSPSATAAVKTVSLAEEMKNLRLDDLDELAKKSFSDAKGRFQDARRKATEAFSNEALSTSDRILAMMVRVMGTILEKVDNPTSTLAACRVCLEELHAMPAVQKSFNVELTGGFKSWFNKDEPKEIVTEVCRMNHVIYDVTQMVGSRNQLPLPWPCIDTGTLKIEPLRDARVCRTMDNTDLTFQGWSFGQRVENEHKIKEVKGIATNSKEHFIVGDNVFDGDGKFMISLSPVHRDQFGKVSEILAVATDKDDNVYVLGQHDSFQSGVIVFDKDYRHSHCVFFRDLIFIPRALTVEGSRKRIFVLDYNYRLYYREAVERFVEVFEYDESFICNLGVGEGSLSESDITAANENNVLVLKKHCVQVYTFLGVLLCKW